MSSIDWTNSSRFSSTSSSVSMGSEIWTTSRAEMTSRAICSPSEIISWTTSGARDRDLSAVFWPCSMFRRPSCGAIALEVHEDKGLLGWRREDPWNLERCAHESAEIVLAVFRLGLSAPRRGVKILVPQEIVSAAVIIVRALLRADHSDGRGRAERNVITARQNRHFLDGVW